MNRGRSLNKLALQALNAVNLISQYQAYSTGIWNSNSNILFLFLMIYLIILALFIYFICIEGWQMVENMFVVWKILNFPFWILGGEANPPTPLDGRDQSEPQQPCIYFNWFWSTALSPLCAVDYVILDLNLHPFQIQFKSKYLLSIIWPLTNQSFIVNCDYSFVFEYKYEIWILWALFFVCLQLRLKNQFLYI